MQLRTKVAAVAIAGVTAGLLAAALPALAASHASASKSVTGPEVIIGAVHGKKALANAPVIPLRWQGLVSTHSVVNLGGGGGPHKGSVKTLASPAGKLTVKVTSKPTTTESENAKSCRISFSQDIPVTVLGGKSTGAFAGASGPGAAQVKFTGTVPRFTSGANKGQCNPNAEPIASTAVASFVASVVLTVK
jgi:hypothetical protein